MVSRSAKHEVQGRC